MKKKTVPELLLKTAAESGEKIAFIYFAQGWTAVTYNEFLVRTKGISSFLIKNHIKTGDRLAIVSENRPEWCEAYIGISLSGGVAVPMDAQASPVEIRNLLADSEASAIFYSSKTAENVFEALNGISPASSVVPVNFDSPSFNDICKTPDEGGYPDLSGDDVASLIYTSGTTGMPKGVLLTHGNFCSDLEAILNIGLIEPGDNLISILPYHHSYPFMGSFILPISSGLTITFPPSLKGPELLSTIREKGVTIFVGVPQILELIRNGILNRIKNFSRPLSATMLGVLKFSWKIRAATGMNPGKVVFGAAHRAMGKQFRFFASGGAKLNPEVMQDLEALGLMVLEGYGLTETSPVVTFNSPLMKRKPGSVGKPLPTADIKIISPGTDREAGVMEEGEIVIRGPMVMKGYYKNPQETEEVLKGGWFYSGDLGYKDRDGYIFVTGRLKEVIVLSSGKNVYPEDVEKQYLKIPLIKEICVMGIEENGMVQSLRAIVVPDFEFAKTARISNLQEALKTEINNVSLGLPQYLRIKGFTLHSDPLPRTPLGKLRRFMVTDLITGESKTRGAKEEDKSLLEDEVGRKVVECIKPLLREQVVIRSNDNLELDLGFDSLAKIELAAAIEHTLSIDLPDNFVAGIQTVGELVDSIKKYGPGLIKEIGKLPAWKDILRSDPSPEDRKKAGLRHGLFSRLIVAVGLGLLKVVTRLFFRLRVSGIANLPAAGSYIIAPNHASYIDAFVLISALRSRSFEDLYIIGLQRFFTGRLGGAFARLAHVIPIDPDTHLAKALQMASFILRNGKSLLIFPEGGRSYDGELMEFKKGVGILSVELGVPVIPAYIRGSFEALPRQEKWPKFSAIKVTLGKPLQPSDMDFSRKTDGMDSYQFFVNALREKVDALKELG